MSVSVMISTGDFSNSSDPAFFKTTIEYSINSIRDTVSMDSNHTEANFTSAIIPRPGLVPVETWKLVMSVLLGASALVTFFGNILVLTAFSVEKKIRTNFNIFILNLAITDVFISGTMTLCAVQLTTGYWPLSQTLCGLWIFCDWGMTFASIFTLVAISIDRYWAVCWSLHYRTHNTRARIVLIVILIW